MDEHPDRRGPAEQEDAHTEHAALRRRIVRSSAWVGVGFGGGQLIAFLSMLVLVRLLAPSEFGVVAVATALLAAISTIQESGLGAALVHRRENLRSAASSVLVFAALTGLALTAATILVAPLYTRIAGVPEATSIVRGMAFVLAIRGLSVVPGAILERELDFRSRTKAELTGYVVQGGVAVGCAVGGLGAWSLVAGQLAGSALSGAILWILVPWRPSPFGASWEVLRTMLRYGRYVGGSNLLIIANTSIDKIAVSRLVGSSALGVYAIAWRLAEIPNTVINIIVGGRVMFSVYSRLQHDLAAVRTAYVENMQRVVLLALPVIAGTTIAAEPIVLALLGDSWTAAIVPLRIFGIFSFIRLLSSPSGDLFKGIGRPHLLFVAGIVFLCSAAPALLLLVPSHGTDGAALAMTIAELITAAMMIVYTFKVIALRPSELLHALSIPTLCGVLVGVAIAAVLPFTSDLAPIVALLVLALVGSVTYFAAVLVFARPLVIPIIAALRRA